jgi:hypothetical protein
LPTSSEFDLRDDLLPPCDQISRPMKKNRAIIGQHRRPTALGFLLRGNRRVHVSASPAATLASTALARSASQSFSVLRGDPFAIDSILSGWAVSL